MFLSFLIILMTTTIPGVTTKILDFTQGVQKYMTHRVYNNANVPSRTSLYLEDVPDRLGICCKPVILDHAICWAFYTKKHNLAYLS